MLWGEIVQFASDVQFYGVMQDLQAWFTLQGQSLSVLQSFTVPVATSAMEVTCKAESSMLPTVDWMCLYL
jgi:hypothetical protein